MARIISQDAARSIAYAWHGGQNSGLYSFASIGYVYSELYKQTITSELRQDLAWCEKRIAERDMKSNIRALKSLLRYIESVEFPICSVCNGDGYTEIIEFGQDLVEYNDCSACNGMGRV